MKYGNEPSKFKEICISRILRQGYLNGKVYILGGYRSGNKVEVLVCYSFEQKQKMKDNRGSHGVAVLSGNIHIIGGCDGDNSKTFNSCEVR